MDVQLHLINSDGHYPIGSSTVVDTRFSAGWAYRFYKSHRRAFSQATHVPEQFFDDLSGGHFTVATPIDGHYDRRMNIDMNSFAKMGAQQRLQQLQVEREQILRAFPDLGNAGSAALRTPGSGSAVGGWSQVSSEADDGGRAEGGQRADASILGRPSRSEGAAPASGGVSRSGTAVTRPRAEARRTRGRGEEALESVDSSKKGARAAPVRRLSPGGRLVPLSWRDNT